MTQKIFVNTTPEKQWRKRKPVLAYSQGDIGREWEIAIEADFEIPSGATVKMEATKPSGFGFSVDGEVADGIASFVTTEIMTDEAGRFEAELKISYNDVVIGTANFLLYGEANPHPDGTIDGQAEEVIPELTQLVERVEDAASSVLDMTVEAETLAAGAQATYSYDEETNTATFGIPQGEAGAGAVGVVASAYSASSTYAVGDYVIHNSNLYRCTTAITTAEAFTAGHWTQVVLGDDVSDLKSAIKMSAIPMQGNNQYIKTNLAIGAQVSYTPTTTTGYKYAIVNCSAGDAFVINASGGDSPRTWCFVNSSDLVLARDDGKNSDVKDLIIYAPENAAKLIINDKSGGVSYKGDYLTKLCKTLQKTTAIASMIKTEELTGTWESSYYINNLGVRTYNVAWKYRLFSAKAGDIIMAISAGIAGTSSAIFSYANGTYTPLVISTNKGSIPYVYEVLVDGLYGVNSSVADPTKLYIMHKSADVIQLKEIQDELNELKTAVTYEPALKEKDNINRFSTQPDMLLTAKEDCIYHDNFDRDDDDDDIGYNFVSGEYIDEYDTYFPVGITNKVAYSSNPNSVTGKHFKLYDAGKFPYIVTISAPDNYTASMTIGFVSTSEQINLRIMGGSNDRYVKINYAGVKPEVNLYDQYRKFTRLSACVWSDHFDIYLDGRYFQSVSEEIKSTLCGMMFSTGADYRYTWFSVSYPSKFEEIGFDEIIEKYGLINKGYVTETGNVNGIIVSNDMTVDSNKSIRFRLNRNDELASGSKRSEIGLIQRKKHNLSNKIYSFDVYFDSDYLYDSLYEIIFQLHTFADDDNYAGLIPSTSLTVQKDVVTMAIRGQSDKAVDNNGSTNTSANLFTIERNKWYHFLIYQREAYTTDGNPLTICFVDGECKFYSENINSYNADNGTYPKWGIYKTPWKDQTSETTERTIFVDNIRMWY